MPIPGLDHCKWFVRSIRLLKNWPDFYRQRFSRLPPARQILKLRSGLRFEVAFKERTLPILVEVMQRRVYQDGLGLPDAPTIVDVGGHIGASTLFLLQNAPRARVFVFEPEAINYELLRRNVEMNGFADRVVATRQAVCGCTGTRTLFANENSPTNSFFRNYGHGLPVSVECTTLAEIFDTHRIERCDLLKLDCEGAEYEILYAAPSELLTRVKKIILEWHGIPGESPEALETYLQSHGFSTRRPSLRIILAERSVQRHQESPLRIASLHRAPASDH